MQLHDGIDRGLHSLFRPSSIAIVGASDRSRWARMTKRNIDAVRYEGRLFPVNRRGGTVFDIPAATSCASIGEPVDTAILLVPSSGILEALDDLGAARVRSAIILSGGFAETGVGGSALQNAVAARAKAHGVRLLGPNCMGYFNACGRSAIWTGTIMLPFLSGGISIISQSGAVANAISHFTHQQGIGINFLISTGNEADIDVSEAIEYALDEESTKVVCVFMESARNPLTFRRAAEKALEHRKPLVVLKVGRSEITAKSAQAHTGALVGDDAVFDAFCRRYGIIRVRSIEELAITADVLAKISKPLTHSGIAITSISGGMSEISADLADAEGISLVQLGGETIEALTQVLPPFATPHNPLDFTGAATDDPLILQRGLEVIGGDPAISLLACLYEVPTSEADTKAFDLPALRHIGLGLASSSAPALVLASQLKGVSAYSRNIIQENRLPYVSGGLELGMPAIARALWWSGRLGRDKLPSPEAESRSEAGPVPRSEHEAQQLLSRFGVPVVPTIFAATAADARKAADQLGSRVAVKIASEDIAHKSDVGGVMLDVAAQDTGNAFESIMQAVARSCPDARLDGVLVSAMRRGGTELLVGVTRDPQWGPVLAVALGGIFVEILKDSALRLLPASEGEIVEMIGELRGVKILQGFRNTPATDLHMVADVINRICQAALSLGESMQAFEVNPLLVEGDRIEALDALIISN